MTVRSLPAALLLGLLALPLACAQAPTMADPTLGLNVPADYATNDTVAVIPFTVDFSVSQFACLGTAASFTVSLDAQAAPSGNATNGSAPSVLVQPGELTFQVPAGSGLAQPSSDSASAVATVSPADAGMSSNATLTVTATVTGVGGCAGGSTSPTTATGTTAIEFQRPSFADQGDEEEGQAMPGLGLVALLAAFGVALLMRRSA